MNDKHLQPPDSANTPTEARKPASAKRRCVFCGQEAELVWIHGHGQCAACGINVEECCRGENCSF